LNGSEIRRTLESIGAISESTISLFSANTRDVEVNVFRDEASGVIFIDEYFVGEKVYVEGDYRGSTCGGGSYEDIQDTERRLADLKQYFTGKCVVDIGCGEGSFLRGMRPYAKSITGVELLASARNQLTDEGIPCVESLAELGGGKIDAAFMMHVLEHLPDPLLFLKQAREKLVDSNPKAQIVVEVPHARDFLIDRLRVSEFVAFTLWSQHLVLHTRESLRLLLAAAGFTNITVRGVQRYPLSNHLAWLAYGLPGGHKSSLSEIDSASLCAAYSASLAAIDGTDTLLAIAEVS